MPDVSIVMAVYNGERYLREALESVLAQSFEAFECVIVDDASTDKTPEILAEYAARDARVRVFRNEKNRKLAQSLNRGVAQARGKYIARMDADDICLRDRLERQYAFMEQHPEIGVASCRFFALRGNTLLPTGVGRACDADSMKAMFLFFDPVLHPGVIARAELMRRYPYDPACTCTEDMDLWVRMLRDGVRFAGNEEYLMLYRMHEKSISATTKERQGLEMQKIAAGLYRDLLFPLSKEELVFYINYVYFPERCELSALYRFYQKILAANAQRKSFVRGAIRRALFEVLAEYHRRGVLRRGQTLSLLRFGAASAWLQNKARARRDMRLAEAAARAAGFARDRAHTMRWLIDDRRDENE